MAHDSITYSLSGEVSLDVFASSASDLRALVEALSAEIVGKHATEWVIEYMEAGSATWTFAGRGDAEAVEKVVLGYSAVGRSLEQDEPVPYSQRVEAAARRLTSVLNGEVSAIRFETPEETATVVSPTASVETQRRWQAYGAIEGRVQTLSSHGPLRFVLYDSLYGKAVYCYLQPGSEEQMRGAWDRRATVEGWVSRDPVTGRPVTVRNVSSVSLLDEPQRGAYRKARGVVPLNADDPSPEETLKLIRDAS